MRSSETRKKSFNESRASSGMWNNQSNFGEFRDDRLFGNLNAAEDLSLRQKSNENDEVFDAVAKQ